MGKQEQTINVRYIKQCVYGVEIVYFVNGVWRDLRDFCGDFLTG